MAFRPSRPDRFCKTCQVLDQRGGNKLESIELARKIVNAIADKKGSDIILLDLRSISLLASSIDSSLFPPYVFRTKEHFSLCPECDRIYWRGTHWDRMCREIARIRSGLPTKQT